MQKVLANAGIGSRRECEAFILEGRVAVDGEIVDELGSRVDATRQQIRVDGVVLPRPQRLYFILNKPTGVVCTNRDPSGRTRAVDLIPSDERLFTVGRLDRSSEGLLIITNDGELANQLTHPRYGIEKTYRVRVAGHPAPPLLAKLRRSIRLADGFAKVAAIRVKRRYKANTELEIVLNEGRNREIRRILARIGHKVQRLKRVAMGPLQLGDLPSGAYRPLKRDEIQRLRKSIRENRAGKPAPAVRRKRQPRASASPTTGKTTRRKSDEGRGLATRKKHKALPKKKRR